MRRVLRLKVAAERIRAILDEEFQDREGTLLSLRWLAQRIKVSHSTVRRAVLTFIAEGRLRTEHGRGTFVVTARSKATTSENVTKSVSRRPYSYPSWAVVLGRSASFLLQTPMYRLLYDAVTEAVLKTGDTLLTLSRPDNEAKAWPIIKQLQTLPVRGVILVAVRDEGMQKAFVDTGLPVVLLDDVPKVEGLDYVVADNRRGTELLIQKLTGMGHRSFAFVRSTVRQFRGSLEATPDADSLEREQFTRVALRRCGLELAPSEVIDNYAGRASKREIAGKKLLTLHPRPTAVLASGEDRAVSVIRVLTAHGIKVPEQMSVCAFCAPGDDPMTVSGVEIDFELMAQLGIDRLRVKSQTSSMRRTSRRILTPISLREGCTWGPAPDD